MKATEEDGGRKRIGLSQNLIEKRLLQTIGHEAGVPRQIMHGCPQGDFPCYPVNRMPQCLKCGAELAVNEEGIAPVLCDRCAGVATSRARRGLSTGTIWDYPATTVLVGINVLVLIGMILTGGITGAFGG